VRRRAAALSPAEAARLLSPLAAFEHVILAVSGGADSMALLHLAADWQKARGGRPALTVATVDHRLRSASAEEAVFVAAAARALGLAHRTLVWPGPHPTTGLQAAAREARYRLLEALALEIAPADSIAIATAHHADDQAETAVMRFARGSGLAGLSAMAARARVPGGHVALLRPLLEVGKRRLLATLEAAGLIWREDPSNADRGFERVRVREALAALAVPVEALALSVRRLARADRALEALTARLAREAALDWHAGAFATIERAHYDGAEVELRLRLLARMIGGIGAAAPPPRLVRLEALVDAISAERGNGVARTLGGCRIVREPARIVVVREPGRRGLAVAHVRPGESFRWDGRYDVALAGEAAGPLGVRALGTAWAGLRGHWRGPVLPAGVAVTLPALWRGDRLLTVPHLAAGLAPGALALADASVEVHFNGRPVRL
jgi:tRNA(Ile)-lysidine synthase